VPVDTPCGSGGFLSADTLLLALYMGLRRGGQGQVDAFHQGALAASGRDNGAPELRPRDPPLDREPTGAWVAQARREFLVPASVTRSGFRWVPPRVPGLSCRKSRSFPESLLLARGPRWRRLLCSCAAAHGPSIVFGKRFRGLQAFACTVEHPQEEVGQ
jgi:hypothetical protein